MKKLKTKFTTTNFMLLTLFILILNINANLIKNENKLRKTEFVRDLPIHSDYESFNTDTYSYLNDNNNTVSNYNITKLNSNDNSTIVNEYHIESMEQVFTLDSLKKSCDLNVKERVQLIMNEESSKVDYILISKKTPLYGFHVSLINNYEDNFIKEVKIYQDSSFRQRVFIDAEGKRLAFRDRWLVSLELMKPFKELELEIEYNMQRALLIDSTNEANYLKFALINPHYETVNKYTLTINLENFTSLKPEDLKVPLDSLITHNAESNNIQISTKKPFEKHTEYEVNLNLPYELTSCEGKLVNVVYYGLIGMSVVFVIMSIGTLAFLYKE